MPQFQLLKGDTLEVLMGLEDNSVDAIVTDPPYGLSKPPDMAEVMKHWLNGDDYSHKGNGFMGKTWDSFVPGPAVWRECLRVLKPGGHLLAFGGTRTYDLLVLAVRLGGFEVRDQLAWVYGSGFPKSLNVEKATGDKHWEGWGTALKPAFEPILLARKPLDGTVANNVLQHGVGGLNIDGCRVDLNGDYKSKANGRPSQTGLPDNYIPELANTPDDQGRFPANLIHDGSEEVLHHFPDSSVTGNRKQPDRIQQEKGNTPFTRGKQAPEYTDRGSAARFFYCAKATKKDRNDGLEHFEETTPEELVGRKEGSAGIKNPRAGAGRTSGSKNNHPTVKPTSLMQWLVRLVTPVGGTVLDAYVGSGSTGKAAMLEGFDFIGIDKDEDEKGNELGYLNIAKARIMAAGGQEVVDFDYEDLIGTSDPVGDLI